jgi:enoyl-CoA hydratase
MQNDPSAEVLVTYEGALQIITLNRPAVRNAVNMRMAVTIDVALDEFERRTDIAAAIITGAGNCFCAGMDLKAFGEGQIPRLEGRGFAGVTERVLSKPLISAVEGLAMAGGFEIVLASDLVVASQEARFALAEIRRGLVAAGGGLMRLARRIPYHVAMEYSLTGDSLSAVDAHRYGLVSRLVPAGGALAEARRLALRIADNAPLAIAATKRIVRESREWPESAMFDLQRPIAAPVIASADAQEGAAAFVEKRRPVWQGR